MISIDMEQLFSQEKLIEARESATVSREMVAANAGVSLTTIRSWELGLTRPNADKLATIANTCGVEIGYFYESSPDAA